MRMCHFAGASRDRPHDSTIQPLCHISCDKSRANVGPARRAGPAFLPNLFRREPQEASTKWSGMYQTAARPPGGPYHGPWSLVYNRRGEDQQCELWFNG